MKTLHEIRKSSGYKKLMRKLINGETKSREVTWSRVEEIAREYSYLSWKLGEYPIEKLVRAIAYHDHEANQAL